MPERPLLRIPAPEPIEPPRRGGGGPSLKKPTRGRQGERLDPKFDRLARVVADPAQLAQLRQDPEAIAPERAIVFEVAGSLLTFYEEATLIGLEYLADDEVEIEPDDDFRLTKKPDEPISGRLYFAMPDVAALRQLVSLWRRYKASRRMADGFGVWTQLFGLLKDVRAWGPQDRLTTDTLAAWEEQLERDDFIRKRTQRFGGSWHIRGVRSGRGGCRYAAMWFRWFVRRRLATDV